jgi:hypothetical protein
MEISTLPLAINTSRNRFIGGSEEEVEEIVRSPIQFRRPSSSLAALPRSMRAPIRRRLHIDECNGTTYQMYELSSTMGSRTSMDGSEASSSSVLTMATSAGSSGTDPWSSTGFVEEEEEHPADFNWDEEDEEEGTLVAPKVEPVDDVDMADFSPAAEVPDVLDNAVPGTPTTTVTPQKRPRGRPRKHPKPTPESLTKVAKGRSKTGCITCRKRKKKCDETKPGCKFGCTR